MARKSRKNMMPQAAVQEAVQQNEKNFCARQRMRGCRLRTAGMKQKIPCTHRFCKFIIISGKTRN